MVITENKKYKWVLPGEGRPWVGVHCHAVLKEWCKKGLRLNDFHIETCLGSGVQSMVFRARLDDFPEQLSIKVFDKGRIRDRERRLLLRELHCHLDLSLRHPHIVHAHCAFEDARAVYLVLQYARHGDLFRQLQTMRPLKELDVVQWVIAPVLDALRVLHSQNCLHRDIKPENLFLGDKYEVLVGDFGLSIDTRIETPMSRVGTPEYWAPEVLQRTPYTYAVDVWTIGILAYELLSGQTPFYRADMRTMETAIQEGRFLPLTHISPSAQDFLEKTLNRDASQRPTVEELLRHPWITSVPLRRIGRPPRPLTRRVCTSAIPPGIEEG